jgi:lysozyme family protein
MASFESAYKKTLEHEGGYVNDPDDAGGETYKGVARRFHSSWPGWMLIDGYKTRPNFPKNLDNDTDLQQYVKSFYRQNFWDQFAGDQIPDQDIGEEMFDTSVNMGIQRAVTFLQSALNVLNRDQSLYPDLVDDGKFGPKTLQTLNTYLQKDKPELLLKVMNILQGMHYINYMKKSPTQEKFARGWFGRVLIIKS